MLTECYKRDSILFMSFNLPKLVEALDSSGASQKDVDKKLGYARGVTNKYITGRRNPNPSTLYRLLAAMGWTIEQIEAMKLADWYPVDETLLTN